MRTTRTVTIAAGQTTGYATLGPFERGTVLQGFTLFGSKMEAGLTARVAVSDRPISSAAEMDAGDPLTYSLALSYLEAAWALGMSCNCRLLHKRYLTVEFVYAAGLAANWSGGINVAALPKILHRWATNDTPNMAPGLGLSVGGLDSLSVK